MISGEHALWSASLAVGRAEALVKHHVELVRHSIRRGVMSVDALREAERLPCCTPAYPCKAHTPATPRRSH